jgi:hypothetical protein
MQNLLRSPAPASSQRIDEEVIRVGKDVIELITSGMYVAPITIYREYVQNAADSLDLARSAGLLAHDELGRVDIKIDHSSRAVSIRDNGIGISPDEAVPVLLAIGDSPKRGTRARGFRGVGRLAGLAYCGQLEFTTKASGSDFVTKLTWDCKLLRARLVDRTFGGDVRHVIADAVSVTTERAQNKEEHFFEVHMRDIARHRLDLLLNEDIIEQYLGQVAPVPFHPAFSSAEIEKHLQALGAWSEPITLTIQGEAVYRPYRDVIPVPGSPLPLRIESIELISFADVDGQVGAVGWIGHHAYTRSLPLGLGVRGLRARVGNVQIGESDIFEDTFKESRFNGWSIGEIHVVDRRIVPNARRDNFEVNHHSYNLLAQLGPVAAQITHRCRTSSRSRNAAQTVMSALSDIEVRLSQARPLDDAERAYAWEAARTAEAKLRVVGDAALKTNLAEELSQKCKALEQVEPIPRGRSIYLEDALALVAKVVTNSREAKTLCDLLHQLGS